MNTTSPATLPYKSVAAALMFSLLLGPVGLLYATFWGGLVMIPLGFVVIGAMFPYPIILYWLVCCIWSVGSVNSYNKKILISRQG